MTEINEMAFCQDQKRGKYLLTLYKKSRSSYSKLLQYVGDEDTASRVAASFQCGSLYDDGEQGLCDDDIYSDVGLEQRGATHFLEACDLINALTRADKQVRVFDLILTRMVYDEKKQQGRETQIEVRMNRVRMIERLEWISSLDFGDNIDAWEEWRQIRMEEGFFTGR